MTISSAGRVVLVLCPILAMSLRATGQPVQDTKPRDTLIRNVNVVDVEAGRVLPNHAVLISGDRIEWVRADERVPADGVTDATLVDGTGRYLLPGLFDAHVHMSAGQGTYGPLLVAHGVTCVRDTGAATGPILSLREQAANGRDALPRIVCTGAIVDGDPPVWPFSEACDTPEEARAAVRRLVAAGVDQIKVYSRLELEVYRAAVDEAHEAGLKVTGHIPAAVTFDQAMAAGQDCNEHLMGFDKMLARLLGADELLEGANMLRAFTAWQQMPDVDREKLAAELARVRASGMVQCPTVVVMQGIGRLSDESRFDDPRLAYVPEMMRGFWESGRYGAFGADPAWPHMRTMVGELHRAGVTLMIGTDLANPYVFAGSSVHDEMKLFQDAGIPPADVLRAATIVPARFCGVDDDLGSIAAGKTASLVLVRANPLDDVANASKIDTVFLRGRRYDRAALDGLHEGVRSMVTPVDPADVAGADAADGMDAADLPGEIVRRGTYRTKFHAFDAGSEDFAISRDEDGWHVWAHGKPQGGPQQPFVLTWHAGTDFAFRSAVYRQLTGDAPVTTYAMGDRELRAERVAGDDTDQQVLPLPARPLISGPAYVLEFVAGGAAGLEIGQSRTFDAVGFGFPSWQMAVTAYEVTRHENTEITRPDGSAVTARHYSSTTTVPGMKMETETWTDGDGVMLKSIMSFPGGTLTTVLE